MTLLLGMTTCGFLLGEMAILATFFVHENECVFWAQIVVTLSGPAFDVISAFVRRGEGKDVKTEMEDDGSEEGAKVLGRSEGELSKVCSKRELCRGYTYSWMHVLRYE